MYSIVTLVLYSHEKLLFTKTQNNIFFFAMSDELKKYDFKKFKGAISVDKNHSLQYLRKQTVNADEIVFTIHITNKILKSWDDIRQMISCSFVEILNCFLAKKLCNSSKERQQKDRRKIGAS